MRGNRLHFKTGAELAGIQATVRNTRLGGNGLFQNRTRQERDNLLMALARVNSNPAGRLDLSGNGGGDYQRAILPMASLAGTRLNNNEFMSVFDNNKQSADFVDFMNAGVDVKLTDATLEELDKLVVSASSLASAPTQGFFARKDDAARDGDEDSVADQAPQGATAKQP